MPKLIGIERDSKGRIPQKWCIESAIEESKRYESKKEFRVKSNSAYQYLRRHGKLGQVCLPGKRHRLDTWEIFCSLKKSKTWGEFRQKYPKEYTAFQKRKCDMPEQSYIHLGISKTAKRWTKETIRNEAKKYKHRSAFAYGSPGAYDAAQNYGILSDVCSHMESLQSDFDCAYMWVAKKKPGKFLVKFGVTSKRLGETRIRFVESKSKYKAEEIIIVESKNALKLERKLKSIGESAGLSGFSGATEFYWLNQEQIKLAEEVMKNETVKQRVV